MRHIIVVLTSLFTISSGFALAHSNDAAATRNSDQIAIDQAQKSFQDFVVAKNDDGADHDVGDDRGDR